MTRAAPPPCPVLSQLLSVTCLRNLARAAHLQDCCMNTALVHNESRSPGIIRILV